MLKPKSSSVMNEIDPVVRNAFNLAYHRSKDARLQRAREIADSTDRVRLDRMTDLSRVMPVDPEIDRDNADPYLTMLHRQALGKPYVDAFLAPGAAPQPAIRTSTNIADYPAINPPRSFNIWDFHDTVKLVIQLDLKPGNDDGLMVLPGGMAAELARKQDLRGVFPMPPAFATWALPHFGVVINGLKPDGELVVDAEEVLNQPDEEAALAYIRKMAGL